LYTQQQWHNISHRQRDISHKNSMEDVMNFHNT